MDALKFGIIGRRKAPVMPTVDAEAYKCVLTDMVLASGMNVYLSCRGVNVIMDAENEWMVFS